MGNNSIVTLLRLSTQRGTDHCYDPANIIVHHCHHLCSATPAMNCCHQLIASTAVFCRADGTLVGNAGPSMAMPTRSHGQNDCKGPGGMRGPYSGAGKSWSVATFLGFSCDVDHIVSRWIPRYIFSASSQLRAHRHERGCALPLNLRSGGPFTCAAGQTLYFNTVIDGWIYVGPVYVSAEIIGAVADAGVNQTITTVQTSVNYIAPTERISYGSALRNDGAFACLYFVSIGWFS